MHIITSNDVRLQQPERPPKASPYACGARVTGTRSGLAHHEAWPVNSLIRDIERGGVLLWRVGDRTDRRLRPNARPATGPFR